MNKYQCREAGILQPRRLVFDPAGAVRYAESVAPAKRVGNESAYPNLWIERITQLSITDMATLADDFLARPTEAQGYLVVARGMLAGALPLERVTPMPVFAVTLLCGHSCEAALKAVLAQSGIAATALSKAPYGHDILHLWKSAEATVPLPTPQPEWVAQLDRVYDKPFHLRYPLGFHGLVLPNQLEMLRGTESLVLMAASYVK